MNRIVPLLIFILLVGIFAYRLLLIDDGNAPEMIPSVMIGKSAPEFNLPPLQEGDNGFKTSDLKGKITLINFFASWCIPCRAEHQYLFGLADRGIVLAGIDYKDDPDKAKEWLNRLDNPYTKLVTDHEGLTAINFGVYGVPESYLLDKQGIIRFKQTGPLTHEIIEKQLLPLIKELDK